MRAWWLRPLAWFYALLHFFNAMGHTVFTFFGQTMASVTFPRPAPGFYSSPFLFAGIGVAGAGARVDRPGFHTQLVPKLNEICPSDDSRSEEGGICCHPTASTLHADSRFLSGFAGSE